MTTLLSSVILHSSVSLILIYLAMHLLMERSSVFSYAHTHKHTHKHVHTTFGTLNSRLIGTSNKWDLIGREGRDVMTGSVAVSVSLYTWIKRSQLLLYLTIHSSLQPKAQRGTPAVSNQTLLTKCWQQGAALCLYFVWGDHWEVHSL